MKLMPLTQNKFAIVDDEDYELLSGRSWYAAKTGTCWYAKTGVWVGNGRTEQVRMHRFLLNPAPNQVVDHANGNGLDNRRSNLRICTRRQNQQNMRARHGTSRFKGVHFDSWGSRWRAKIKVADKSVDLGSFHSEEQAARAYDAAALSFFGVFARPNFLKEESNEAA